MGATLIVLFILYIVWDANYLIRLLWVLGQARLANFFGKKVKVTDTTTINGIVTTQDVDIFFRHMNNAKYLRELDFARFHYFAVTGLYETVKKNGGGAVQASNVRYRRGLQLFAHYRIATKLVWWDDKAIYLEQKFITVADDFVRAIVLSKQWVTKDNVMDLMKQFPECGTRPEISGELKLWLDSIETSSKNLRKDN